MLSVRLSVRLSHMRITSLIESLQLKSGIKKAGPVEGMHRFLAFRRPLRCHTHRFLAAGTTVTRRCVVAVTGYRASEKGSGKGLSGWDKG